MKAKKFMAALMTVAMVLTSLPVTAFAADGDNSPEPVIQAETSGTITLTKDETYTEAYVVPAEVIEIDLGGFTLTAPVIKVTSDVTFKNGTITCEARNADGDTGTYGSYLVDVSGKYTPYGKEKVDADVTLEGVTVQPGAGDVRNAVSGIFFNSTGSLTITGSKIYGADLVRNGESSFSSKTAGTALQVEAAKAVMITGSEIYGGDGICKSSNSGYDSDLVVTGGYAMNLRNSSAVVISGSEIYGGDADKYDAGEAIKLASNAPELTVDNSEVTGGMCDTTESNRGIGGAGIRITQNVSSAAKVLIKNNSVVTGGNGFASETGSAVQSDKASASVTVEKSELIGGKVGNGYGYAFYGNNGRSSFENVTLKNATLTSTKGVTVYGTVTAMVEGTVTIAQKADNLTLIRNATTDAAVTINGEKVEVGVATAKVNDKIYTSIDAAINAAGEGDTIELFAGTFAPFTVPEMKVNIVGAVDENGDPATVIYAEDGERSVFKGHYNWKGTVSNIRFEAVEGYQYDDNPETPEWGPLYLQDDGKGNPCNVTFKNCDFIRQGVHFAGVANFENCTFDGMGTGYSAFNYCCPSGDISVKNCTFDGYTFASIHLAEGTCVNALIEGCTIKGGGIEMGAPQNITIKNSTVNVPVNLYAAANVTLMGNKVGANGVFKDNSGNNTVKAISGTFVNDPGDTVVTETGYVIVQNGDKYVVTEKNDGLSASKDNTSGTIVIGGTFGGAQADNEGFAGNETPDAPGTGEPGTTPDAVQGEVKHDEVAVKAEVIVNEDENLNEGDPVASANIVLTSDAAASIGGVELGAADTGSATAGLVIEMADTTAQDETKATVAKVELTPKAMNTVGNAVNTVLDETEEAAKETTSVEVTVEKVKAPANMAAAYDISVEVVTTKADGTEARTNALPEDTADTNGDITVTVPAPQVVTEYYFVYYIADDGRMELVARIPVNEVVDGYLTFTTDHLSTYHIGTVQVSGAVNGTNYTDAAAFVAAINAAPSGAVVSLLQDITIDVPTTDPPQGDGTGAINIAGKKLTINGNGHTITAGNGFAIYGGFFRGNYHVFNIIGNSDVIINDLIIDGGWDGKVTDTSAARSGVNVWTDDSSAPKAELNNVTIRNCTTYGVTNGSGNVTLTNVTTSGSNWGGVNADTTSASNTGAVTVVSGTFNEPASFVVENKTDKTTSDALKIEGGTFNGAVIVRPTVANYQELSITGGTFNGDVSVMKKDGDAWKEVATDDSNKEKLVIAGGTFKDDVAAYADQSQPVYQVTSNNGQTSYFDNAADAAAALKKGDTMENVGADVAEGNKVTIDYKDGITVVEMEVENNAIITLPAKPAKGGYKFRGWNVNGTTMQAGDEYEVTDDTTIEAQWKKKSDDSDTSSSSGSSSTKNDVAVEDSANGSISVNNDEAKKGDTVTVTVTPDKGYKVDEVTVTDEDGKKIKVKDNGDGTYSFTMPASEVEIEATFEEIKEGTPAEETKPAETPEGVAQESITLTIGSTIATVDGTPVVNDVAPIIRNDRTMLPIRFVAEALGAEVGWNEAENKVTITKGDLVIEIYIGQPFALVNGNPVQLDVPAFIENGRTYLPLRFVAENLGAIVTWDGDTKAVTIVPGK